MVKQGSVSDTTVQLQTVGFPDCFACTSKRHYQREPLFLAKGGVHVQNVGH